MKLISSILFLGVLTTSVVSAQNNSTQKGGQTGLMSVGKVNVPSKLNGNNNYMVSLSENDFKNKTYIFYTDSNATVAHLSINGNNIRLTGGPNAENIMAYTCKGFTVTFDDKGKTPVSTAISAGNQNGMKVNATLVIYSNTQTIGKKVTGIKITGAKN